MNWSYYLKCGVLEQIQFAYWIQATNGNLPKSEKTNANQIEESLKRMGWYPDIDPSHCVGVPLLHHWYPGHIGAGMQFLWEPFLFHATALVEVTRVQKRSDDEALIWVKEIDRPGSNTYPQQQEETYNDESRFREACVPPERLIYITR